MTPLLIMFLRRPRIRPNKSGLKLPILHMTWGGLYLPVGPWLVAWELADPADSSPPPTDAT